MLKFHVVAVVLLGCLIVGLGGCGEPEPLQLGFVGELSGRRSEIGVAARNGAQLMVDQINEAGGVNGRPVVMVAKDNQGDTERCKAILEKMIEDGTQFVVGPLLSQMAVVTLEAIEGKDVLVMSPTMSTDYLSGRDDNLVRTSSTTSKQAVILAKHTARTGAESVAVVYDLSNRKYTELLYTSFAEAVGKMGIEVPLALTIRKTGHPGMMPLAKQIAKSGADAVLMCLSAVDAANLAQQIRKLDYPAQLVGVSWSQTDDLIRHGGRAVEGMLLVATKRYVEPGPVQVAFKKAYTDRHQEPPSFAAGRGYEAAGLLLEAMRRADRLTPGEVKSTLLSIKDYQGVDGVLQLDAFGDSMSGYSMVTVEDGKYVPAD